MRSILLLALAATSCGYGPSLDLACQDFGRALCARYDACVGGQLYPRTYADEATCVARYALACETNRGSRDTHITPIEIERCAESFPGVSCAGIATSSFGDACTPAAGTRASGASCISDEQCSTHYCNLGHTSLCGQCAEPPATGSSCASSTCAHGQLCYSQTQTCLVPIPMGMPCTGGTTVCEPGSICSSAAGQMGTCVAMSDQIGAACAGSGAVVCDSSHFLACEGALGTRTCQIEGVAQPGALCGALPDGTFATCQAGTCFTVKNSDGSTTSTCQAEVLEGNACDLALGPFCLPPARCITSGTGTAGMCQLATPESC